MSHYQRSVELLVNMSRGNESYDLKFVTPNLIQSPDLTLHSAVWLAAVKTKIIFLDIPMQMQSYLVWTDIRLLPGLHTNLMYKLQTNH